MERSRQRPQKGRRADYMENSTWDLYFIARQGIVYLVVSGHGIQGLGEISSSLQYNLLRELLLEGERGKLAVNFPICNPLEEEI